MMKIYPDEIAGIIPGVKPVMNLLPCDQEITKTTTEIPASTEYAITADRVFKSGKTYYELKMGAGSETVYVEATVTVGAKVPDDHYFEKYTVEAATVETTVVYERYHTGKYPVKFADGCVKNVEHPVEIRKTITGDKTVGTVKTTIVSRWHALGIWAQRASLEYVPLCERMEQNGVGESARIF